MSAPEYLDTKRVTRARWTPRPLDRSRTGYGSKLPTSLLLQLDGRRWHRVYVMQWSNAGTAYVLSAGKRLLLESSYDPSLDGVPTTYDAALAR